MSVLHFQSPVVRRGNFVLAIGEVTPRSGCVTVLLGPNGGGKSTLLRVAAGLMVPESGHVLLDGTSVNAFSATDRAARISLVAQRADVGAPFSVRDVVSLGSISYGFTAQTDHHDRVEWALQRMGLASLADHPFHALSGGQQQRVAVARALRQHRRGGVLLLDEAFAAVDPPEAAAMIREIRIEAAAGATVLAATHDLAIASALADDLWCIRNGGTQAYGPAERLLHPATLPGLLGVGVAHATGVMGPIAVADYRATLPSVLP